MANIRLSVPRTAVSGEVIELKALVQHPMESGYRRGSRGEAIPRDIITNFECSYDGETIFKGEFGPGIAANPFLSFHTVATKTGTITFRWTDQHGEVWSDSADILVT